MNFQMYTAWKNTSNFEWELNDQVQLRFFAGSHTGPLVQYTASPLVFIVHDVGDTEELQEAPALALHLHQVLDAQEVSVVDSKADL